LRSAVSPVHRYLLDGESVRPNASRAYLGSLSEKWWQEHDPLERHKKYRAYCGKLTELRFAEWLESQGWVATNLEAWGGPCDVTANTDDGATDFEIKTIGVDDVTFEMGLSSFEDKPLGHSISPQAAADYLLFRAHEAAGQLTRHSQQGNRRVAVIIIEELAWDGFVIQLGEGWIDWGSPAFSSSDEYSDFIRKKHEENPCLQGDLADSLRSIDEVWFFKLHSDFRLSARVGCVAPGSRLWQTKT
jgi:hypothetical protein